MKHNKTKSKRQQKNPQKNSKQAGSKLPPFVTIDFETRSEIDIKTHGAAVYAEHLSTEIIVMGYKFSDDLTVHTEGHHKKLFNFKGHIVTHNYKFEYAIIKNLLPFLPDHWHNLDNYLCTMATALRCGLPAKLGKLSKALNLKRGKLVDQGQRLINKYSKPHRNRKTEKLFFHDINAPENAQDKTDLWEYNEQDVLATEEIFLRLPKLHEDKFEFPIFQLDKKMNEYGIRTESKKVVKLIKSFESYTDIATAAAEKIAGRTKGGALVINSPLAFREWLNNNGCNVPNTQAFTLEILQNSLENIKRK